MSRRADFPVSRAALISLAVLAQFSVRISSAQSIPSYQLSAAEVRYPDPFSSVSGTRELADRRVMVLDLGEHGVVVVDEKFQSAMPVGRQGNGPGEYNRATKLLALPNGQSAILDWGNTRLLSVGADGTPGRVLPANARCATNPGQYPLFTAADQDGRFYSEGTFSRVPGPPGKDSTAIIRWRTQCAGDTLGMFRASVPPRDGVAFITRTQWVVNEGGTIAIVHPEPYRVSFIFADGRRHEGPSIRYEPIRVTDAIKQLWREEQQIPMGVSTVYRDGRVSGGVKKKPYTEPKSWPAVLPPFLLDAAAFDGEGNLWVKRTVKPGEPPAYDVISSEGRVIARVLLRAKSRVVGFGKEKVYVVWRDDDDLEFLERHAFRNLR